jgi:C-terminal processing protease CtpA/Prc
VYFSPQQARQFAQELSGSCSGMGVAVDVKSGRLTVTKVFPESPAAGAGITPCEVIVSVDGAPTAGRPASEDVARIIGPAGTQVRLQVLGTTAPRRVTLTLTRRPISLPLTTSRLLTDHGAKVGHVSLSSFAKGAGGEAGCWAARGASIPSRVRGLLTPTDCRQDAPTRLRMAEHPTSPSLPRNPDRAAESPTCHHGAARLPRVS